MASRVGLGVDSHPFGPGAPLRLGGIEFPDVPRLVGHSDGDVALHAVADALLGAAGLGDLGRVFPADDRTPTGIESGTLLEEVRRRVLAAGWRVTILDVTIVAARPRLAARLDGIRGEIARLLDVSADAVSVKASSGNLAGDAGAGRAIEAQAVVMLEAAGDGLRPDAGAGGSIS
jgi:2-C-methyl-D-erythritol 2,4-cyclodiphosphate synthase